MNFDLSDEQRLLQDTARDWFSGRCAPADMRRLLDGAAGAPDHTAALAEMGFLGMLVDAGHGGGGLSVLDLAVVAEEAGRVLAGVPLVSTAGQATSLLTACGGGEAAEGVLRDLAAGREVVAVVEAAGLDLDHQGDSSGGAGRAGLVLDAARATSLLLVAGDVLVHLPVSAPGVTVVQDPQLDPTRAIGQVRLEGARGRRIARGAEVTAAAARARDVARAVLAAEDLGSAVRCLETAVEYAGSRVAFGRPIGSFQAIKHSCVDMFVLTEQLRSLVWFAAWAADADPAQLPLAAAAAHAYAADAFEQCAESAIQVHGGIGFTWEHDAHLFWRRAKVDRLLFGDADSARDSVAELALAGAR